MCKIYFQKIKCFFHKLDFLKYFSPPLSVLFFENAELEHQHTVDGGAMLWNFEEKIGFWQSSCLTLPFLVSNGFKLMSLNCLFKDSCVVHTCWLP